MQVKQFIATLSEKHRKEYYKEYERQRLSWPYDLVKLPIPELFAEDQPRFTAQWRSRFYMATVWNDAEKPRITVNRTELDAHGDWKQGIALEDLTAIKNRIGFGAFVGMVALPREGTGFAHNIYTIWLMPT